MKLFFKMFFIIVATSLSLMAGGSYAQDSPSVSIEVSPAYFLMEGYGGDILVNFNDHHAIGLSFSEAEFPNKISSLFFSNISKNANVRWSLPYSLQYRYYVSGHSKNTSIIGAAIGKEKWLIEDDGSKNSVENYITSVFLSYQKKISGNIYFTPTIFLLINSHIEGDNSIELRNFSIGANLNLGYRL